MPVVTIHRLMLDLLPLPWLTIFFRGNISLMIDRQHSIDQFPISPIFIMSLSWPIALPPPCPIPPQFLHVAYFSLCFSAFLMSVYQSYELYEIIGHGASCTVKRAVRKDTRQVFAAKLYEADFLTAKNEVEMLVRLDHPNIVNIYEVFEEEDCIILILEYMQGGELYDFIGQKDSITEQQVRDYMKVVVDAIRYCHEMSVVHRDIKPENLLLTSRSPQGLLKLADFGISKIMSDDVLTTNCGTPVYMAPEIWAGRSYDNKVDVWSLGVVMYYLLSGTHPFLGDTDTIGEKIQFEVLSFEGPVWSKISSKATDLLRRLLEKDPRSRLSATEATAHIWFSYIQPIYTTPYTSDDEEDSSKIRLKSVHKIRRYNQKRKCKRSNKKLESLLAFELLNYSHQVFLKQECSSITSSTEESVDTFTMGSFPRLPSEDQMEIEEFE